jgi:hypothetical protein
VLPLSSHSQQGIGLWNWSVAPDACYRLYVPLIDDMSNYSHIVCIYKNWETVWTTVACIIQEDKMDFLYILSISCMHGAVKVER